MPTAAGKAPFAIDGRRTAITIAFLNKDFIADQVMRRVRAPGERFTWKRYRLGETFRLQDTLVGRKSQPNEVEFGYDEIEATTEDHGLEDPVPQKDIDNAQDGDDPLDVATTRTTEKVLLNREKRVADMVNNPSNYAYSTVLTGAQRFTNYTVDSDNAANESDPTAVIETGLNRMIRRANTMIISEDGFSILSRHPKIVSAFHGNDGKSGMATEEFIKRYFRLENLFIGAAWVDSTNNLHQNSIANLTRLWGQSISLVYLDPSANLNGGVTWGFTAQWKTRFTSRRFDPDIGLEGGQRIRIGEHVKELVVAPEYGFLIQDAFLPAV